MDFDRAFEATWSGLGASRADQRSDYSRQISAKVLPDDLVQPLRPDDGDDDRFYTTPATAREAFVSRDYVKELDQRIAVNRVHVQRQKRRLQPRKPPVPKRTDRPASASAMPEFLSVNSSGRLTIRRGRPSAEAPEAPPEPEPEPPGPPPPPAAFATHLGATLEPKVSPRVLDENARMARLMDAEARELNRRLPAPRSDEVLDAARRERRDQQRAWRKTYSQAVEMLDTLTRDIGSDDLVMKQTGADTDDSSDRANPPPPPAEAPRTPVRRPSVTTEPLPSARQARQDREEISAEITHISAMALELDRHLNALDHADEYPADSPHNMYVTNLHEILARKRIKRPSRMQDLRRLEAAQRTQAATGKRDFVIRNILAVGDHTRERLAERATAQAARQRERLEQARRRRPQSAVARTPRPPSAAAATATAAAPGRPARRPASAPQINRSVKTILAYEREQQMERWRRAASQRLWVEVVATVRRTQRFAKFLNDYRQFRKAWNLRRDAVIRIQGMYRRFRRRREMRKARDAMEVLVRNLRLYVFRRRRRIKRESADLIKRVLLDIHNTSVSVRLVRVFVFRVTQIQRIWRTQLALKRARLELLCRQWDRIEGEAFLGVAIEKQLESAPRKFRSLMRKTFSFHEDGRLEQTRQSHLASLFRGGSLGEIPSAPTQAPWTQVASFSAFFANGDRQRESVQRLAELAATGTVRIPKAAPKRTTFQLPEQTPLPHVRGARRPSHTGGGSSDAVSAWRRKVQPPKPPGSLRRSSTTGRRIGSASSFRRTSRSIAVASRLGRGRSQSTGLAPPSTGKRTVSRRQSESRLAPGSSRAPPSLPAARFATISEIDVDNKRLETPPPPIDEDDDDNYEHDDARTAVADADARSRSRNYVSPVPDSLKMQLLRPYLRQCKTMHYRKLKKYWREVELFRAGRAGQLGGRFDLETPRPVRPFMLILMRRREMEEMIERGYLAHQAEEKIERYFGARP